MTSDKIIENLYYNDMIQGVVWCMQGVQVVTWCHGVQVYTVGQFIHMVVKVNIYSDNTRRIRGVTAQRENEGNFEYFCFIFQIISTRFTVGHVYRIHTHTISSIGQANNSDWLQYQQVTSHSIYK